MTDFFISYTSADEPWAEWVGFVLEEEGFSVILQAWDFRPGSNFVLEMQRAAATADRTIMVLSPDYTKSQFAAPEWAAAFSNDPQGMKRSLVPVVVRDCQVDGLLKPLVHINLLGLSEEEARARLLSGIRAERAKPSKRPAFPGQRSHAVRKAFPGNVGSLSTKSAAAPYLPKVQRAASDIEKRRFLKQAFEVMRDYFRQALEELSRQASGLEFDFQPVTALEFTAEIFHNGNSVCACRIWQGGMISENGISYAEGRHHFSSNSCNESLSLIEDGGDLALSSLMGAGFGFGHAAEHLDLKRLTPEQAAEYLWRRFVSRLES